MTPETVVIVEEPPDLASVTVLPATGFDCASRSVTVTVELAEPSAVTDAGAAATLDCAAVTAPAVKRDRRRLRNGDRVRRVVRGEDRRSRRPCR